MFWLSRPFSSGAMGIVVKIAEGLRGVWAITRLAFHC